MQVFLRRVYRYDCRRMQRSVGNKIKSIVAYSCYLHLHALPVGMIDELDGAEDR